MFVSVSRRTDIPAFYSEWFFNRLCAGFADVRNPVNPRQISRIVLTPETVDGFIFWSKNPAPMLKNLGALEGYPYYFQFTLNAYGPDAEPNLPSLTERIRTFKRLSDRVGPERVLWRYDPVMITARYTQDWHLKTFERLTKKLAPYTARCTFSFMDFYKKTARNTRALSPQHLSPAEKNAFAARIGEIAGAYGLRAAVCAEEDVDAAACRLVRARCVDSAVFEKCTGTAYKTRKDKNQRAACGCVESVDIGAYDTCAHGCAYCYANAGQATALKNCAAHRPDAPMLTGCAGAGERVSVRDMPSLKTDGQMSFLTDI